MLFPCARRLRTRMCLLFPIFCLLFILVLLQGDPRSKFQVDLQRNFLLARGLLGNFGYWNGREDSIALPTPFQVLQPDCGALFSGNTDEIEITREMIYKESRTGILPSELAYMARNCTQFRDSRGYQSQPYTNEEGEFSLAYIMLVHNDAEQVERLLHAIYVPQNAYCIYIDSSATPEFYNAIISIQRCFQNVILASKSEHIVHSGISRLKAELQCIRDLILTDIPWKYIMNIHENDFPLTINAEIVASLNFLQDSSHIPMLQTGYHNITYSGSDPSMQTWAQLNNVMFYMGTGDYIMSKQLAGFAVKDQFSQQLLSFLNGTKNPCQYYWTTLYKWFQSIEGSTTQKTLQSMLPVFKQSLTSSSNICDQLFIQNDYCLFEIGDLYWLAKQGSFFAHGFDLNFDHITVQCLEERLQSSILSKMSNSSNIKQALDDSSNQIIHDKLKR